MVTPVSTRKLCYEILKVDKDELLALVADADNFYKPYKKTKIRPDGTPKVRDIEPSKDYLKDVQKLIDKKILKPAMDSLPPEIMGGRPGVSIVDNARLHAGSKAMMKYDVQNFFPSITHQHIYRIFRYRLNFCEEAANILTKLTTYPSDSPHVPQGAPTSTSLAMFTLEPLAVKLGKYSNDHDMKSSFWVDDITVSGSPEVLKVHRGHVNYLVNSTPYMIHPDKDTGIIKKGQRMNGEIGRRVTGVVIDNTNRLTLGNDKYKSLKRRVMRIKKQSKSLLGSLLFLRQVSPKQGRPLVHEYYKRVPKPTKK